MILMSTGEGKEVDECTKGGFQTPKNVLLREVLMTLVFVSKKAGRRKLVFATSVIHFLLSFSSDFCRTKVASQLTAYLPCSLFGFQLQPYKQNATAVRLSWLLYTTQFSNWTSCKVKVLI